MSTEEPIPQYSGPATYRGPTMGYLIAHHQLAAKIIETHAQHPANILDRASLALLRDCVRAPDRLDEVLKEHGIEDAGEEGKTRNLVSYCMANDKFDEGELELLREWFKDPQVQADLQDPKYDS
jgi:hypothetical protein